MIYEVAAAVEHIVSLVQQVERDQPVAPEALAAFVSTLKDSLETRCQKCWNPAEPENGSACRSVAWHLHPAGEGADRDLLRAFASVVQARAQEGEIVPPHHSKVVQLALEWLPLAFTLWIDPGCVAIRTGTGPGAARSSSFDCDHLKSASSSIHVIWGQMVAQPAERHMPQLTVSSAAPRPVPIVKPTLAVAHSRYPVSLFTNLGAQRHSRSPSSASSSASSSCQGLVRSASLSSTHTVSTDATSLSGLEADAESDTCPSLGCSPASSLASTHCTPTIENDRESVHDTTIGDADATQRFAGIRLFDDDAGQEDDEAGDATIDASPMLGLSISKIASAGAASHTLGAGFNSAPAANDVAIVASSNPVKCNYTTHDNGNVGVLGGGVRLGGGGSSAKSGAQPPRHRQHLNSKSVSYLHAAPSHGQLLPAYVPRQHMPQRPQFHHMNAAAANYSAPMPTVPLPAAPLQHQHQQYQGGYLQHQGQYQQHQHQQYAAPQPRRAGMGPFGGASQLPAPFGFPFAPQPPQKQQQQGYAQYAAQQQHAVHAVHLDAAGDEGQEDDADKASAVGRRRLRSRGRRSRGRGAGRAARRQAAAMRALELGSTDELPEFDCDEEDDDELGSRCSTPATSSEYTAYSSTASSVYSSAASSPAKAGKVSQRTSRNDLRGDFGRQICDGLARLVA
ncbi:hypothetical protein EX895_005212 [Sporisorium graminicola]|uniref:Anti-proliferative protein domain-containing protein n=1 Tax=Sporisorium graminicola TaxID=280036 RepID=A0A4U7KRR3_9BASI|nr:hypothetical protein EX895_005212 [Sporisorium graminicola]TKY85672.1 hypothetical protein EX895_005212 [Sporisorium graminicola]